MKLTEEQANELINNFQEAVDHLWHGNGMSYEDRLAEYLKDRQALIGALTE